MAFAGFTLCAIAYGRRSFHAKFESGQTKSTIETRFFTQKLIDFCFDFLLWISATLFIVGYQISFDTKCDWNIPPRHNVAAWQKRNWMAKQSFIIIYRWPLINSLVFAFLSILIWYVVAPPDPSLGCGFFSACVESFLIYALHRNTKHQKCIPLCCRLVGALATLRLSLFDFEATKLR